MNFRFLSILNSALIVFALSQSATANNWQATDLPRIRADVSKNDVQIAEPFQLTLSVAAPTGSKVVWPAIGKKLGEFDVVSQRARNDIPAPNATNERFWNLSLSLESIVTGDLTIPAIEVQVAAHKDSNTIEKITSEPIQVRVISVLEGRTDPTQFRDIRPVVDIESAPTQSIRWMVWAVGGFVVLASSAAIVAFSRRETTPAPTHWAIGEINRVERELERQAIDQETGLTQLSMILRDYLELQFEISAQVQSTPELLQILKSQQILEPEKLERLNNIFESADQVKFAGFKLRRESMQQVFDESRVLVRGTASFNAAAEKRAPGSNQQGGN